MSSTHDASSIDWGSTGAHDVRNRIHEIEPLLELGDDEWTVWETPLDGDEGWRLVRDLVNEGVVHVVGSQPPAENEDDTTGSSRNIYQWDEQARRTLERYRDTMPTLPCDCRTHVPAGREYPDGWMRCKHCETAHRKAVIREHI
jgi:hypothetical protein